MKPTKAKPVYDPNLDLSESDDSEDDDPKGKGKGGKDKKDVRRRSSKACMFSLHLSCTSIPSLTLSHPSGDNCRKSKCKCARVLDPETGQPTGPCENCLTTGAECTYLGASRKRGPPKGYIEAIESRLHRMEALLGGLLQNDDPRAQALLTELIGNDEAREVLTKDLKAASTTPATRPRKSWKKAEDDMSDSPMPPPTPGPIVSRGFTSGSALPDLQTSNVIPGGTPRWFTDEELNFGTLPGSPLDGTGSATFDAVNALGFDPSGAGYRFDPAAEMADSDDEDTMKVNPAPVTSMSSSVYGGIGIPIASPVPGGSMNPLHASGGSASLSIPRNVAGSSTASGSGLSTSPRQRRRLNHQSPIVGSATIVGAPNPETRGMAYSFQTLKNGKPAVLSPHAIAHTGQASYSLSADAELSPAGDQEETGAGMSELADVVGQLSLNENEEVRYHGRSSGLYLISKSKRYKDFFWQFPSSGVWPPADGRVIKTEDEILREVDKEDPLPDRQTQQHLLDLYWCYVHPHFPILYKVSFMRQYRHLLSNPNSTEPSTPSGGGKVPMVLLFSMFALASRYSDLEPPTSGGKYWTAGQDYFEKAKLLLNYDYGSSKLVNVQALLLMAYREIGTGGMSASWLFSGMAIRVAQDLGLFRDVEKWYMPVQRFSHEEKQTRKRVWWGCLIMDRYTSSYIGRPGTIHERDYDTSFPSEDEPDEHEQWRPIRPDGTDWTSFPKTEGGDTRPALARYPPMRAHTMSCFNAAGALAVVINRIIVNIYAIRTRVLGQSSETLLSLLDQSLASWYLALPAHLAYNPASKKVPPPHVLCLHLQFYSALILLHRPFIPGQNSEGSPTAFPSHSICTTAATAIANIVTIFSKTFSLRQCPPFLTYPIFSAAVICVYNAGFDEALALPAKIHLVQCMDALKEMETVWGSAIRQWELLHGLVDLRDAELGAALADENRGVKRPAVEGEGSQAFPPAVFNDLRPANFHSRPLGRNPPSTSKPRKKSTSRPNPANPGSTPSAPPPPTAQNLPGPSMTLPPLHEFGIPPPAVSTSNNVFGVPETHHSFDIFTGSGPAPDLSGFRSPPRSANSGGTDFSQLLQSFMMPTEMAGNGISLNSVTGGGGDMMDMNQTGGFNQNAFFGLPISSTMTDEWANYLPQAFFSPDGQGVSQSSPDSGSQGPANHPSS